MNLCPYASQAKCTECKVVFYKKCKMFAKYHAADLVRDILPFKFRSVECPNKQVIFSRDEDKLKSAALLFCSKKNFRLKKLTLNQVMSVVLNKDEDISGDAYYIECKTKPLGEVEKVLSVMSGFIDNCILKGKKVFICSTVPVIKNQDWFSL